MEKSRLVPPVGLFAVAVLLRVICDDELTDEIVVPDGIPVPVTVWFASRPSVVVPDGKVTMLDPLVSVPVKVMPPVGCHLEWLEEDGSVFGGYPWSQRLPGRKR